MKRKFNHWLLVILPLLMMGLVLAACDTDDEEGGGAGLGNENGNIVGDGSVGGTAEEDIPGATDGSAQFTGLDANMDGYIDRDEFSLFLTTNNLGVENEALLAQYDADVDAQLSAEEFNLLYGENRALFDVGAPAPIEPTEGVMTDTATVEATAPAVEATVAPADTAATPAADVAVGDRFFVVRASDLIDMAVLNENGEEIATFEEALVDEDGNIQFAILNTTPLEELDTSPVAYAIAMTDLEARPDDAETEIFDEIEGMALYYVSATPLEQQTSFDMNILEGNGYVIDDPDLDDDLDFPEEYLGLIQLQDYADYEVVGRDGDSVANIEDALVDLDEGTVLYLVGDVGGFLGLGETTVLIPWSALTLEDADTAALEDEVFRTQLDEETLEQAPTFDLDAWELPDIDTWDEEFAAFWAEHIDDDADMDANANTNTNTNTNTNSNSNSNTP